MGKNRFLLDHAGYETSLLEPSMKFGSQLRSEARHGTVACSLL
jgi:hypothetical protein